MPQILEDPPSLILYVFLAIVVLLVLVSVAHLGGALALTVQRYYTFSAYIEQENAVAAQR